MFEMTEVRVVVQLGLGMTLHNPHNPNTHLNPGSGLG